MNENTPLPVAPDHICPRFVRVPESLMEEPEVCEFCTGYTDGFCLRPPEEAPHV